MNRKPWLIFIAIASLLGFLLCELSLISSTNSLQLDVANVLEVSAFETPYYYGLILLFAFIPVFALSFDQKVAYYKEWKHLFPAVLLVGLWFVVWDVYFTQAGIWDFNTNYHLSAELMGLPIEELSFFAVVPFASYFIYRCLNVYFPVDPFAKFDDLITKLLIAFLVLLCLLFWDRAYTLVTCAITALFLIYHLFRIPNKYRSKFYRAYLIILVPFLLVDGALTGMFTLEPVVIYNPSEFSGLRIITIPIEDAIYGFLLMFMIISLRESRAVELK